MFLQTDLTLSFGGWYDLLLFYVSSNLRYTSYSSKCMKLNPRQYFGTDLGVGIFFVVFINCFVAVNYSSSGIVSGLIYTKEYI